MSRLIILSVVVLPQPDGPSRTQISPSPHLEVDMVDGNDGPPGVSNDLGQVVERIMRRAARARASGACWSQSRRSRR